MIYDTNFLVAIQGRKKGFTRAEAIAWMKREDAGGAYVPRIVEIEFLGGFAVDDDAAAHHSGTSVTLSPGLILLMSIVTSMPP